MSGHLIITSEDRENIQALVLRARERTMPLAKMMEIGIDDSENPTDTLTLKERKRRGITGKKLREVRVGHEVEHIQLGSYDVAFSFEEQPTGVYRHISISSSTPNKVPNEFVVEMVTKEFGFSAWPPSRPYRVWVEEYEQGKNAVNFVELADDPE